MGKTIVFTTLASLYVVPCLITRYAVSFDKNGPFDLNGYRYSRIPEYSERIVYVLSKHYPNSFVFTFKNMVLKD